MTIPLIITPPSQNIKLERSHVSMSSCMLLSTTLIVFSSFRSTTLSRSFCETWFPMSYIDHHDIVACPVKCRNVTMKKRHVETLRYPDTRSNDVYIPVKCSALWASGSEPTGQLYWYRVKHYVRMRLECAS